MSFTHIPGNIYIHVHAFRKSLVLKSRMYKKIKSKWLVYLHELIRSKILHPKYLLGYLQIQLEYLVRNVKFYVTNKRYKKIMMSLDSGIRFLDNLIHTM